MVGFFAFKYYEATYVPTRPHATGPLDFPSGYEVGTWLWKDAEDINTVERHSLADFCVKQKINTIYLDIGKYNSIAKITDSKKKDNSLKSFENAIGVFIKEAHSKNLQVEALSGDKNWANPENEYLAKQIVDFVTSYNSKNGDKFDGIHFDIEFYSQDSFTDNPDLYSLDYLNLIKDIKTQLSNSNSSIRLGLDLTYWLDNNTHGFMNKINWNGKKQYVIYHILDELSGMPGSYVTLLAYRSSYTINNGPADLVRDQIKYIDNNDLNVKVSVGLDTDKNTNSAITFYGQSKDDVKQAVIDISDYYHINSTDALKGFSIHNLLSFRELSD